MRKAPLATRIALATLFVVFGGVQVLPHVHAKTGSFSFTTPPSSSPLHRCWQCAIPHAPALAPGSFSFPGVGERALPLPGHSFKPLSAAFLLPGKPRAPPV